MIRSIALVALTTALMATAAHAATLTATGSVMVNTGNGFKAVSGTVEVRSGDRVLVGADSEARVAYNSTCVSRLPAHAMLTVLASAPCEGMMRQGATNQDTAGLLSAESVMLVPFSAMVAGGIAGAIVNSRGSDAQAPASP